LKTLFCPRWGTESEPWDQFCGRVKAAGYDGVETGLPVGDRAATDAILSSLRKNGLALIAQHWETVTPRWDEHAAEYKRRLEWLTACGPLFVNSQTGKDWFTFEENQALVRIAHDEAASSGVRILHETHRGKFAFAAAVARRFLADDPKLRITADFSHWCTVSESLLEDQAESLDVAIARTDHLHARVGHPEGPQASDPAAPEWADALSRHLTWWDRIADRHRKEGAEVLTVTPEAGPVTYMPSLPYTRQPVADQWMVNVAMMERLRKRWG